MIAPLFAGLLLIGSVTQVAAKDWTDFLRADQIEKGSGDLETEERAVEVFTRIESNLGVDIDIKVGSPQKVTLTFDDNLLDNIKTRVRGKTLEIKARGSFSTNRDCTIEITVASLEEVDISGSGDITITNLDSKEFSFNLSGSGSLEASGKVEQLFLDVSGSGEIDTRDLIAQEVEVDISGSGNAVVYAVNSLDGDISGSGDIRYVNEPQHVSTRVTGSGTIRGSKR
jgi:hypothetical protein